MKRLEVAVAPSRNADWFFIPIKALDYEVNELWNEEWHVARNYEGIAEGQSSVNSPNRPDEEFVNNHAVAKFFELSGVFGGRDEDYLIYPLRLFKPLNRVKYKGFPGNFKEELVAPEALSPSAG